VGQPDDVIEPVAFPLSDDASYINGTSLMLESGTLALRLWSDEAAAGQA